MAVDRVRTGIEELDQMLSGGFVRNDAVLLEGTAGTGKSTLALQYLFNGAKLYGENGIYLTFEELPQQTYRDAKSLGWDLRELEEEGKLKVICTSPEVLLEDGGEAIFDEPIKEIGARRVAIDSLSHLEMFAPQNEVRKEAYRILNHLKTKGLTSLSTWEIPQLFSMSLSVSEVGLGFMVDCVMMLRFVEIDSTMRKAILVLKMRGSDHERRLREYQITKDGVKVSAPFIGYDSVMSGAARRSMPEAAVDAWTKAFQREKSKD